MKLPWRNATSDAEAGATDPTLLFLVGLLIWSIAMGGYYWVKAANDANATSPRAVASVVELFESSCDLTVPASQVDTSAGAPTTVLIGANGVNDTTAAVRDWDHKLVTIKTVTTNNRVYVFRDGVKAPICTLPAGIH